MIFDKKKNLAFALSVTDVKRISKLLMREKCGVMNVKHPKHMCEANTRVMRDLKHTCEGNTFPISLILFYSYSQTI